MHRAATPNATTAPPMTRRALRNQAHRAFDDLWASQTGAPRGHGGRRTRRQRKAALRILRRQRKAAYAWLADKLGIPAEECHFGRFGEDTLWKVIRLCRAADPAQVRRWPA
jgi:hypothetical protein